MNYFYTSLLIVFTFIGSVSAQNGLPQPGSANESGPVGSSSQNGDGVLGNMFNVKKCGLNYVSASSKVPGWRQVFIK